MAGAAIIGAAVDAVGASGAGGGVGGTSNAGACTGTPAPAIGAVGAEGATCDGCISIDGCGNAFAGAEARAPACIPASKLCSRLAGVIPWAAPVGDATVAPDSGEAGTPGSDGVPTPGGAGAPGSDGVDAPATDGAGDTETGGAAGAGGRSGAGRSVGPAGLKPAGAPNVEPGAPGADGGAASDVAGVKPAGAPNVEPLTAAAGGTPDAAGCIPVLLKPGGAPIAEPGLSSIPRTCFSRSLWSSGCRNIWLTSTPWALENWRDDCPVPPTSRIDCIASSTLPPYFAAARLASARCRRMTLTICVTFVSTG